jgi:NAD(P)-dependent dehydrogenase (short-subunit alcohol dehydrogenase family)
MKRFAGKIVGVTGAAQGIGAAIALRFAREGANVALFDVQSQSEVVRACQKLGVEAMGLPVDISSGQSVEAAVRDVVEQWKTIHVWVNNAGMFDDTPLDRLKEDRWDQVIGVNYKGHYFCAQAVASLMIEQGWGRIINIASMAAKVAFPNEAAYCSSKAAVLGLTRALAAELGPRQITVNAVCPGPIDTAMLRGTHQSLADRHGMTLEMWSEKVLDTIPVGRFGKPEDVASLVAYLATEEAGFINGQAINVDGGMVFY